MPKKLIANMTNTAFLALICMALALAVAKYFRHQPSVEVPSAVASGVERKSS
jgi:hypothetical protein